MLAIVTPAAHPGATGRVLNTEFLDPGQIVSRYIRTKEALH
jgi:hypothetical protein